MGSRIAVLRDGVLQQLGGPQLVYDHPINMFVAGFIGSPAMNFVPARVTQNGGGYRVSADGFQVEVPRELAATVGKLAGREVIFGLRPEDIADRSLVSEANPAWTIRAGVDVHEPLGSDVILYLTVGPHSIVARVDAHSAAKMGQQIEVVFNMRKMHLFDPQTQEAIV